MRDSRIRLVSFTAMAMVIVIAIILAGCNAGEAEKPAGSREIAALINGQNVYYDDVNEFYAYQSQANQATLSKADALSMVIEREILYQEGVRRGFQASKGEIISEYTRYLASSNITEGQLGVQLASVSSSIPRLKSALGKRIIIGKLLDSIASKNIIVRKEDVQAVYNSGRYASLNITFEQAEKGIVDYLTAQRQAAEQSAYIERLKDEADVLIVAVPS